MNADTAFVGIYYLVSAIGTGLIESRRKVDASPLLAIGFSTILFPILLLEWATEPDDFN